VRRALASIHGRTVEIVVVVVAIAARLGVVLRDGGLHGIIGYDCGVYFAGADALIHGRMPYRDFTMVHPPGITLILTPFALLTRVMTDWHAFIIATLAFCVLGGVNAVLVVAVCRRFGFGTLAAGTAGLFYAAWFGSVSGEFEVKLEPLANFFLLCGLMAVLRAQRHPSRWATVVAGLVLGLTMTVKIWWVVPVAVLVVWHAWRRRSVRSGAELALGATTAVIVVYTPFFVADPTGMFSSVVTDQLGRPRKGTSAHRLSGLTTVPELFRHMPRATQAWVVVPFVLVTVAILVLAWRASIIARILVALVIIQLVVLFAAPSWFEYYSDYVAVSLSMTVGAAASTVSATRRVSLRQTPSFLLTATMLTITTAVTIAGTAAIRPYSGAAKLTHAVRHVPCVMTNFTTLLIRVDALTRGLKDGCPNWIDITGRVYGPDKRSVLRTKNETWHDELTRYLRSGNAIILWQATRKGFAGHSATAVTQDGVLARAGGHTIYRVRH